MAPHTCAHTDTHMVTNIGAQHVNGVWTKEAEVRREKVCTPAIGLGVGSTMLIGVSLSIRFPLASIAQLARA